MTRVKTKAETSPPPGGKLFKMPVPSPDQLAFLKSLNLRSGQYDPTIVVGGPSRIRKPTA